MKKQVQFAQRNWSRRAFRGAALPVLTDWQSRGFDRAKRSSAVSVSSGLPLLVAMLLLTAGGAEAGPILSGAVSYEYFGLNFAENIATSTTVGTLNYTGGPGCGGTCTATTQLGSDPSASLNVNTVVFDNTCCGGAIAELGYYAEYDNAPGIYTVTVSAPESLSITDQSNAFAYLAVGLADGASGTLNPFNSYALQEVDCVNACQYLPVGGITPAPFTPKSIQMTANTLYFVLLDLEINPSASGLQQMAFIDPTFSTTAPGGSFDFSAGVTDASAMPEPGALVLMLTGLLLLCGLRHQRGVAC
jgi:hypothetical protein